jgi:hypothetical protein
VQRHAARTRVLEIVIDCSVQDAIRQSIDHLFSVIECPITFYDIPVLCRFLSDVVQRPYLQKIEADLST